MSRVIPGRFSMAFARVLKVLIPVSGRHIWLVPPLDSSVPTHQVGAKLNTLLGRYLNTSRCSNINQKFKLRLYISIVTFRSFLPLVSTIVIEGR